MNYPSSIRSKDDSRIMLPWIKRSIHLYFVTRGMSKLTSFSIEEVQHLENLLQLYFFSTSTVFFRLQMQLELLQLTRTLENFNHSKLITPNFKYTWHLFWFCLLHCEATNTNKSFDLDFSSFIHVFRQPFV